MNTTTVGYKEERTSAMVIEEKTQSVSSLGRFAFVNEFNRFGIMTFAIMVQSCLGSVAAYFIFQLGYDENLIPLSIAAFSVGLANAFAIGQAPMKWVFRTFVSSLIISVLLIVYCLIIL